MYGFDPLSGITLFARKIDSGQPYTVNVYDTKIRFQKGTLYTVVFFILKSEFKSKIN